MRRILALLAAVFLSVSMSVPAARAASLDAQVAAARAHAGAFADLRTAQRAGWRPFGGPAALMGQHYFDPSNPDYLPGQGIDPRRPSNLLYAEVGGRPMLVGVAYNMRLSDRDVLPEGFAGRSDVWHVHDVARFARAVTLDRPLLRWAADTFLTPEFEGGDGVRRDRLAMVHLWTIPNPDGAFASHNRALAYLQLGLPTDWARGASKAAARGLALAGPDGCAVEIDTEAWIANVDRATKRRLHSACRQVVDYMRPRLGSKAEANAAGEAAWAAFEGVRDAALTPAQKVRIAAIVEDGPGLLCR